MADPDMPSNPPTADAENLTELGLQAWTRQSYTLIWMAQILGDLEELNGKTTPRPHTRKKIAEDSNDHRVALLLAIAWMLRPDHIATADDVLSREVEKNRTAIAATLTIALADRSNDGSVTAAFLSRSITRVDAAPNTTPTAAAGRKHKPVFLQGTEAKRYLQYPQWSQYRTTLWEQYVALAAHQNQAAADHAAAPLDEPASSARFDETYRQSLTAGGYRNMHRAFLPVPARTRNYFSKPSPDRATRERFGALFTDYRVRHTPTEMRSPTPHYSLRLLVAYPHEQPITVDEQARSWEEHAYATRWITDLHQELCNTEFLHAARCADRTYKALLESVEQPTKNAPTTTPSTTTLNARVTALTDGESSLVAALNAALSLLDATSSPAAAEAVQHLENCKQAAQFDGVSPAASSLILAAIIEVARSVDHHSTEEL